MLKISENQTMGVRDWIAKLFHRYQHESDDTRVTLLAFLPRIRILILYQNHNKSRP